METQNEVFNRMLYYIAISQIFESHLIYFQNLNRWYWKCFRWKGHWTKMSVLKQRTHGATRVTFSDELDHVLW